jgi:Sigma-70, region 4
VSPQTGTIKLNFPHREPWELERTCALDVADEAPGEGVTLERVGTLLNLTRERIRQVEVRCQFRARSNALRQGIEIDDLKEEP